MLLRAAALWGSLAFASGCGDAGDPEMVLDGTLRWGRCDASLLPWRPSFASFTMLDGNQALLRFQSRDGEVNDQAALVIVFQDAGTLGETLGEAIRLDVPGSGSPASGSLRFWEECPGERTLSTALVGSVTLTRWEGGGPESRIAGNLAFDVVDARDPSRTLGSGLTGTFDFRIERYPPFQSF